MFLIPARGAEEQGNHSQAHQCCYCGAHPVAELTEVAVLNNSYDNGAADELKKASRKQH